MDVPQILLTGIVFGESPRWHDGRLWFSDWGAREVDRRRPGRPQRGRPRMPVVPVLHWTGCPDGRLLIVVGSGLLRREPDGSLVTHADLTRPPTAAWNEHRRRRPRQRLRQQASAST